MTEALPTPFDITEIPYVPWSPNTTVWLIFLALIGGALLYLWLRQGNARKKRRELDIVELTISDLSRSREELDGGHDRQILQRMSLVTKRLLAILEDPQLAGLTAHEALERALVKKSAPEVQQIASSLIVIEGLSYAPQADHELVLDSADQLISAVSLYKQFRSAIP